LAKNSLAIAMALLLSLQVVVALVTPQQVPLLVDFSSTGRHSAARPAEHASSNSNSGLAVWVVHSSQQVFENDTQQAITTTTTSAAAGPLVDWAAQRGEAEHMQLAMRWSGTGPLNISVKLNSDGDNGVGAPGSVDGSGQTLSLPSQWLTARQVGQVWVNATFTADPRGPGWWPDPLLPLADTQTMTLEPNQTAAVWLTVRVPVDAQPGQYAGSMSIVSEPTTTTPTNNNSTNNTANIIADKGGSGGGADVGMQQPILVDVALSLKVWNITLTPVALSTFSTFFQFQFQSHPFGADRPSQIRGALEP
jgi:hypothetical protein